MEVLSARGMHLVQPAQMTEDDLANARSLQSGAKEEDGGLPGSLSRGSPQLGGQRPFVMAGGYVPPGRAAPLPTAGAPTSLGPQNPPEAAAPEPQEQGSLAQSRSASGELNGEAMREEDRDLDWVVWSADDVGDWIDLLLGEGRGETFRQNKVDGPTLLELTEDDLRVSLEMSNAIHRQKILGHVRVFQMRRARLAQHAARRRLAENPPLSSSMQDLQQPQGYENGYSPSSRKKQGRSPVASHSVDRLYSNASEASAYSVDSRPIVDDGSSAFTSNRFSRFIGPSRPATTGLTSYFGLDSPSNSVRGSWSNAPCRPNQMKWGPGPCSYNVSSNLEGRDVKTPRATIGNTLRNTSEHFVRTQTTLGGGKFNPVSRSPPKVQGGVIGTSTRWAGRNGRPEPGPASYHPRPKFLSTFR